MTNTIIDIGKPLGIAVHDHLIIGREGHVSFKGQGLMSSSFKSRLCPALTFADSIGNAGNTKAQHRDQASVPRRVKRSVLSSGNE